MKTLGVVQYQQKVFKFLPITQEWLPTLGNIPAAFMCIIYGESGQGKTELCVRLAKMLTNFGKVAWISYEQGHGADLQGAINRNKMEEVSGKILFIDPNENRPAGVSYLEDLDKFLSKRDSPDFIFMDSLKYTRFSFDDYEYLKLKYGKKKAFIWIEHARGKKPARQIGIDIEFDGHLGIYVSKYIAYIHKNRFSAFEPYVIYEKMARILNPLFFKPKAESKAEKAIDKEPTKAQKTKKAKEKLAEQQGVSAEKPMKRIA